MKIYVIKDKGDDALGRYLTTARQVVKDSLIISRRQAIKDIIKKEVFAGYFFYLKKDAVLFMNWVYRDTKKWKEIYEIVPFERIKK